MMYKGYVGTVEYSEDDGVLYGQIAGIDDMVSFEGESVAKLRQAFQDSVEDYLAHCRSIGKEPNRPYSDKFVVQMPPTLHARACCPSTGNGQKP